MDVTVRDKVLTIERAKFRRWLELDSIREELFKAVDALDLAKQIESYISTALNFEFNLGELTWEEAAKFFSDVVHVNNEFARLPFMKTSGRKTDRVVPYDYEGRIFYQYAHSIAVAYGWNLEYISDLDVDDAFKMLQEILIDSAYKHEWEWDLSERAVGYDEATKKAKHNRYPLPDWMIPPPTEPKTVRIPRSILPVGNVIRYRQDAKSN